MTAHEVFGRVEYMHRTALALAQASLLTEHLGHDAVRIEAARQGMSVVSVVRDDVVSGFKRGDCTDSCGFLANIEVEKATYVAERVVLPTGFLKSADEQHQAIHVQEFVFVDARRKRRRRQTCEI